MSLFLWLTIGLFLAAIAVSSIVAAYMCLVNEDTNIDLDKPVKQPVKQEQQQKDEQSETDMEK